MLVVEIPEKARKILETLKQNEFDAYAVGGCIRDFTLGRIPEDWDIATNALPQDVKALFEKTVDTGLKHGTVTVILDDSTFEVTTFRIDGSYKDGRHPDKVEFVRRIEDDLSRRDFTINAMAWNEESGIVDPFDGINDINSRLIKTVGDPYERFCEDALRMLRAVRFAVILGFDIHTDTLRAIKENKSLISNVSSERIREELNGILVSDNPVNPLIIWETGLLEIIMPELEACFKTPQHNPHHVYNVGEHCLRSAFAAENDKCLRWAMLLHDTGKAVTRFTDGKGIDHFYGHPKKSVMIAGEILKRMKFDNNSINKILRLIKFHDLDIAPDMEAVAKAVVMVGQDIFSDLLKVKRADKLAQSPSYRRKGLDYIDSVEKIYFELKAKKCCLKLKDLEVNGRDLINIGFKEGKEVGRTLSELLGMVLKNPELNEKKILLEYAEGMLFKQ